VTKDRPEDRVPPQVERLGDAERNDIYEAAKRSDHEIPRLQAMPIAQLIELARDEGIEGYSGLTKQELIFQLLRKRVTSTGLGWGEGVLDVLADGFGFLRSRRYSYQAGPDDIYVSPSQIRRLNLKQGHLLAGPVRPPKEGEKYFALLHVEAVNGGTIEQLRRRIPFDELTPLWPSERLRFEHPGCGIDARLADLLAPMGKGQRTLLLAPPQSSRTRLLTHLAQGVLVNHPEIYVIMLLVDERPEEIAEIARATGPDGRREVAATAFDEPPARHIALAEFVLERARRMVEGGQDVLLILDSLTTMTRAYASELPPSGKMLCAGLDSAALPHAKRLFASARETEEAGSLTVLASVLTGTDSRVNDIIVEEFSGKANCEIVLDPRLAEQHVYPALDLGRTGTRREDNLLSEAEAARLRRLRASFGQGEKRQELERLIAEVMRTEKNEEFLSKL
jgi:transcription termination factor Rho